MRELKFRAWDGEKFPFIGFDILGETTVFDLCNQYRLEKALKLEITQFTGLKDKNRVDIYEGDILQLACDNWDIEKAGHEVIFGNYTIGQDGSYGLEYKTAGFFVKFKDGSGYWGIPEECIVIGNKFEHPHLLNETK